MSRPGLGLETCPETRFLGSRSRRSQVSFLSRTLRLDSLHRLFFMKFCKEFLKKTVLKNYCSKFNCSKRSVATLSFLLCCLRDGENNLPSTPFKIYTEFNKKCACTNETAARNLCNEWLGVLCQGLSLNCFSKSFVMKPIGLFKRGGRVPKSFFFEKPNKTMPFFRSAFQSTLLKHAGEVFLFWVMQTFLSSKMPWNSLEEKFFS